ncbi:MAG: hypothetical protein H7X99_10905 [Saprospiraceae bacterium]|nr:hypothetical protein [Saprospiraceae bacterium]
MVFLPKRLIFDIADLSAGMRFVLLLLLINNNLIGQNGFRSGPEQGWGTGWSNTDYWSGTGFGTTFGKTYQNSAGNGNRFFRFYTDWSGQTREHGPSGSNDILIPFNIGTTLQTWGGTKAYYVPVSGGINNYHYVFRSKYGNGIGNSPQIVVIEVQGAVQSVGLVSQAPVASCVPASTSVLVTANSSGNLSSGQGLYLRYTTNNWNTSIVLPMSGSGSIYTATIPGQPVNTSVKYYVFTSGEALTIDPNYADWFTINGNTNNGNNFSYTTLAGMTAVQVSPSFPNDNGAVTISFDATGTPLAGASKVYLHSGVSTTYASPTNFNYSKGNWGQDDGIGEMTNTGGNNWQINIVSGLRTFYNVPVDKDIFGLNFLFRNANGTIKEDHDGANYYTAVNPGNYFTITFPLTATHFAPVNQPFNLNASTVTAPNTWTLKEIDPNTNAEMSTLTSVNGGSAFSFQLNMVNPVLRKFKLEADFAGTIKYKTFSVIGYNPVSESPRPVWTTPGINYHQNDPTKATLVLQTPTYTRYKKGTGAVSGTSNSTPKNTVYVIGDFNNWTPSEAFKMVRDRDGWNGSTDSDNDNDRGDYWWIELSNLVPGQEYIFQYLIDGNAQLADPYTHKVSDPDDSQISDDIYPGLIDYPASAYDRASVLQTGQGVYNWTAPAFTKPTDNNLNIYEMHFRDFTEEGTYLAAIEKLDYIKGLGINAIHVMPVSEFEGNSSWGYNPNFYFAADKAYGTANDLKKFIDECHKRKIQVFNDLVLNHAFYSNVMAQLYWNSALNRPADDNPWFNPLHRMVADPGGWWGVDWNHESEHTQTMIDRMLDFWLQEFNFDGFRFDFTKGFGQTAQDPGDPWASSYDQDRIDLLMRMVTGMKTRNPGSVAIFEHLAWASEDKVLADQGVLMWSGVGHHNDVKGFILGHDQDNTNIYSSGIYNAAGRDFTLANWMSYGESHDEERLAFEVKNYFNWSAYSGPKVTPSDSLIAVVNRLKIGLAFNLLFPGPRMIWQFEELGYDYSINFNGRTGEKPVLWTYFDQVKRKELYTLISRILKIRNKHNMYATVPDYGNIGLGAGNITVPRIMRLSSGVGYSAKHVIVIANLDPGAAHHTFPQYDVDGLWYRYNGDLSVDGTSFNVTDTQSMYNLDASEVIILTNFKIDDCTDVRNTTDSGVYSLRDAIACAPDGGEVNIEFHVYNQVILLDSLIQINKYITITGFPSKNVTVSGADYTGSVFSIASGKSVLINGLKIECSQGGSDGRCVINNGILTLSDIDLKDINPFVTGSTLINTGSGILTIENAVTIDR